MRKKSTKMGMDAGRIPRLSVEGLVPIVTGLWVMDPEPSDITLRVVPAVITYTATSTEDINHLRLFG